MPSTITTTGDSQFPGRPFNRSCFYHNGRYWVVYSAGNGIYYTSSTDGSSWETSVLCHSSIDPEEFDVAYDGTYFHYVCLRQNIDDIWYRRGTPNANGTVTWSAAEQTWELTNQHGSTPVPSICVDTNGYPWITWEDRDAAGDRDYLYVGRAQYNDGTWGTTQNQTTLESNTLGYRPFGRVLALAGGRVYGIVNTGLEGLHGRRWNGSSWDSREDTFVAAKNYMWSATSDGDTIHVCADTWVGGTKYIKRNAGWGSLYELWGSDYYATICVDTVSNYVYVFRIDAATDEILYRMYDGSWQSEETLLTDTNATGWPRPYFKVMNDEIGMVYLAGTGSPWNIRFATMGFGWPHSIMGISEPGKVEGIEGTNIAKVQGIAE